MIKLIVSKALAMVLIVTTGFVMALNSLEKEVSLPSIEIETLDEEVFLSENLIEKGKPTLVVFWATCCAPCKKELGSISESYRPLINETNANIVAISVDLPKYKNGVKPFVKEKGWKFPIYLDINKKLMHALNASNTPHTFLFNKEGIIVWEKQGFSDGDEKIIFQKIREVS